MDEETKLLQDAAARFVAKEMTPHADRWDRQRQIDRDVWLRAGEAGLLLASIPAEYGGGGGTFAHDATIYQEICRAGLSSGAGVCYSISACLIPHYILAYGTEGQKRQWLPRMAKGEIIGAIAMTEPGAGSDLQNIRTAAQAVDDGYRLNGSKTYISNGQTADLILVVAKTDPAAGAKGISLIAIEPANAEGFRRGRNLEKMGMHAQDTSELFFDDCFVPAANILGGVPGQGFGQLMQQLAVERMIVALSATVNMELAIAWTTAYARERPLFGKRLWDFQNTQFKLAECQTLAFVSRTFVDALMTRLLTGNLDAATAAAAKLWTTENLGKIADECLQLFGGAGYMSEYPISRLFADARVSRIYGGSSEVMKLIVARTL
ncbi:MAG: acyl-CoA dehydrogenase family protein [Sphingopyxis sp.]|nr:acyl-CoA dehydrogenase family protein [Sphingopyxis sp.]